MNFDKPGRKYLLKIRLKILILAKLQMLNSHCSSISSKHVNSLLRFHLLNRLEFLVL